MEQPRLTSEQLESGQYEECWTCVVGTVKRPDLPDGSDLPMRAAVQAAFMRVTGQEPKACFSGWGYRFTEPQLAVVENRMPQPEPDAQSARIAELEAEVARLTKLHDVVIDISTGHEMEEVYAKEQLTRGRELMRQAAETLEADDEACRLSGDQCIECGFRWTHKPDCGLPALVQNLEAASAPEGEEKRT